MPIDPLVEFLVTIYALVTLPGKSLGLFKPYFRVRGKSSQSDIFEQALRERAEDIPLLVEFHIKNISKRMGKPTGIISKSVINILQNYH